MSRDGGAEVAPHQRGTREDVTQSEIERVIAWAKMQKCRCGEPLVHKQEPFYRREEVHPAMVRKQKNKVSLRRVNTKFGGQPCAADAPQRVLSVRVWSVRAARGCPHKLPNCGDPAGVVHTNAAPRPLQGECRRTRMRAQITAARVRPLHRPCSRAAPGLSSES